MNTNSLHSIYNEIVSAVAKNKDKISFARPKFPMSTAEYTQADFRNDVTDEETLVKLLGQRWKPCWVHLLTSINTLRGAST